MYNISKRLEGELFHCGRPPCTSFHSSPGLSFVQIQLLWPFVLLSFCLSHSIGIILIQMDLSRNKTRPGLHTNHLCPGCRAGTSLQEAPNNQPANPKSSILNPKEGSGSSKQLHLRLYFRREEEEKRKQEKKFKSSERV